ncbi:hypothetical protein NMG60_11017114 [Bertholletia excelsa]
MESDLLFRQRHHHVLHRQPQQINPGLMRYQSAPSSYLASLVDEFLNPRPSTLETDRNFASFMSDDGSQISTSQNLCAIAEDCSANEGMQSQFEASIKHETPLFHHSPLQQTPQQQQNSGYSSVSPIIYQNQSQPSLVGYNQNPSASSIDNSNRVVGSMEMEQLPQMKMMSGAGGNSSNLIRHSSSPAGFFSCLNLENGYGVIGGMNNFGASNIETSLPSSKRLKTNKMDFSSIPPLPPGRMASISENEGKSMGMSGHEEASLDEGQRGDHGYITGFAAGSWDDSQVLPDSFLQKLEDDDRKAFSSMSTSGNQKAQGENHPRTILSHHLSLPKSSAELSALEKLNQLPDSVPCKIRAKRGCATHPRSIAERVRRTRISEKMKKLQELVPSMDKQTNTSDMLDLAVDYIKDLQRQVKTLLDNRAKCTCPNKHQLAQPV